MFTSKHNQPLPHKEGSLSSSAPGSPVRGSAADGSRKQAEFEDKIQRGLKKRRERRKKEGSSGGSGSDETTSPPSDRSPSDGGKDSILGKLSADEESKGTKIPRGSVTNNSLVWELMQEARNNLNEREKGDNEKTLTNKILKMRQKRKRKKKMDRAKGQGIHIPNFIEPLLAHLSAAAPSMDSSFFQLDDFPKPLIQNLKDLLQSTCI